MYIPASECTDVIHSRWEITSLLCGKLIRDVLYQISSQSVEFYRKKTFRLRFCKDMVMSDRMYGQGREALAIWKCCKVLSVLQMLSKVFIDETFMHYFEKISSASGGEAPRPSPWFCLWIPLGYFRPSFPEKIRCVIRCRRCVTTAVVSKSGLNSALRESDQAFL